MKNPTFAFITWNFVVMVSAQSEKPSEFWIYYKTYKQFNVNSDIPEIDTPSSMNVGTTPSAYIQLLDSILLPPTFEAEKLDTYLPPKVSDAATTESTEKRLGEKLEMTESSWNQSTDSAVSDPEEDKVTVGIANKKGETSAAAEEPKDVKGNIIEYSFSKPNATEITEIKMIKAPEAEVAKDKEKQMESVKPTEEKTILKESNHAENKVTKLSKDIMNEVTEPIKAKLDGEVKENSIAEKKATETLSSSGLASIPTLSKLIFSEIFADKMKVEDYVITATTQNIDKMKISDDSTSLEESTQTTSSKKPQVSSFQTNKYPEVTNTRDLMFDASSAQTKVFNFTINLPANQSITSFTVVFKVNNDQTQPMTRRCQVDKFMAPNTMDPAAAKVLVQLKDFIVSSSRQSRSSFC